MKDKMKRMGAGLSLALALTAAHVGAESAGGVGASVAVSAGIRLVSVGASERSAGVAFDARWHTSDVSNADRLNRTWGMMLIFR